MTDKIQSGAENAPQKGKKNMDSVKYELYDNQKLNGHIAFYDSLEEAQETARHISESNVECDIEIKIIGKMKLFNVLHTICNRHGRLIFKEEFSTGFYTYKEATKYIKAHDDMAESNESWVMWEIKY